MAHAYKAPGFMSGEILLPRADIDIAKWAVIACDQFTSQPDYWREVEALVGDAPSAIHITLPEIYLNDSYIRRQKIFTAMNAYVADNALTTAVEDGFVLVERETSRGMRAGLIGLIDLECYDYAPGALPLVRPTEGTVPERLPPRAKIRAGARLDIPHIMMLIDDAESTVIEPLCARKSDFRMLYDFDLMLGGGHITGFAVENDAARGVAEALRALEKRSDGLMLCVGDGNHSLAAAKTHWESVKRDLPEEQLSEHPARYALAEVVNIHSPALVFEPIHRYIKGASAEAVFAAYKKYLLINGVETREGDDLRLISDSREESLGFAAHPLGALQAFLDSYAGVNMGVSVDYIHGEAALRALAKGGGAGFMPRTIDKSELFAYVRAHGVLPRKAFSMGEARDKRYYIESRKLI